MPVASLVKMMTAIRTGPWLNTEIRQSNSLATIRTYMFKGELMDITDND
jgi:hypothetical protein